MALERSFETAQEGAFEPSMVIDSSIFFVAGQIYNSLVLKAREPQFIFIYNTKFSLINNSLLALKLTDPYGVDSFVDPSRITAPFADINTGDTATPTISGGTYMSFSTNKTDFPFSGVWRVQGLYVEGGIERPGDSVYFVVGDSFYG